MQVDLVIAIILAAALALIVGMVSRFLTISGLKKNAESKIGNAEAKAREIIDDAVKTAVDYVVDFRQEETTNPAPSSIVKLGVGGEIQIIRK